VSSKEELQIHKNRNKKSNKLRNRELWENNRNMTSTTSFSFLVLSPWQKCPEDYESRKEELLLI